VGARERASGALLVVDRAGGEDERRGERECGAVRWAAAEPAVRIFGHGPGREGKRARDEVCGEEPERDSEDGSGAREGDDAEVDEPAEDLLCDNTRRFQTRDLSVRGAARGRRARREGRAVSPRTTRLGPVDGTEVAAVERGLADILRSRIICWSGGGSRG